VRRHQRPRERHEQEEVERDADKLAQQTVRGLKGDEKRLRGCLHVYEFVYDSPYDSMNNLPNSQIGIQFFIRHLLPLTLAFEKLSLAAGR
jgi:hypothetical protein